MSVFIKAKVAYFVLSLLIIGTPSHADVIYRASDHCVSSWGQLDSCADIPRPEISIVLNLPQISSTASSFVRGQAVRTDVEYNFPCKSVHPFDVKAFRLGSKNYNLEQSEGPNLISMVFESFSDNKAELKLQIDPFYTVSSHCQLEITNSYTYLSTGPLAWYSAHLISIQKQLEPIFALVSPDNNHVQLVQHVQQALSLFTNLKMSMNKANGLFIMKQVENLSASEKSLTHECKEGSTQLLCTEAMQEARHLLAETFRLIDTEINETKAFMLDEIERSSHVPNLSEYNRGLQKIFDETF